MIAKFFPCDNIFGVGLPESVVSMARLLPAFTFNSISFSMSLAALTAAVSGEKGANPAAIRSALIKIGQLASLGKYSRAKVVFPVPFRPAIMMTFLIGLEVGQFFQKRLRLGWFLPCWKGCHPDVAWK